MDADKTVVYRYKYWDAPSRDWKVSRVYATKEAIHSGLGAPVHDTAMTVERTSLRNGAIYVPDQEAADS